MKDCNQCGKCCIKYGGEDLAATREEIDLWEIFNPEIFKYIKNDELWFDPQTGTKLTRCPFLDLVPKKLPTEPHKYTCRIYFNRPEDCRHYPSLIPEMIRDECEMIEVIDLESPKRAQEKLDKLMQDSRPASAS
jgi:Fe-S-cluster containining protein